MDSNSLEPSDQAVVAWPDRPTCHDADWSAQRFGPASWHTAEGAFRTCSYCGSMHPQDLLSALRAGAKAGGSDWKYGWPHKFYVDQVPAGAVTTHGKWYNAHLQDLSQAAFDELAPLLEQHTGIRFEREANGIKYTAPHHGYQR